MEKNLIIFDCDGVLIDSEYVVSTFLAKMLSSHGHTITMEECVRKFTGLDEKTSIALIKNDWGIDVPSNFWESQETALMMAYKKELTPLLQSLLEVLDTLNIPRCIASNSPLKYIKSCLALTNQSRFFADHSIFSAQHVVNPKPAPDLFLHAAEQMKVHPKNCIVIEDSSAGIDAANRAGMQVFTFVGGRHAGFDWYRDRIAGHKKPMYSTASELCHAIQQACTPSVSFD